MTKISKTLYPWRVLPDELPNVYYIGAPIRVSPITYTPNGGSEEEMWRSSWMNRNSETTPPLVPYLPLGIWAIESTLGDLFQLRSVLIAGLHSHEQPYPMHYHKYAEWWRQGHRPPPIRVYEMPSGHLKISDGNHRVAAYKELGLKRIRAWVSVIDNAKKFGKSHQEAVEDALKQGLNVPLRVAQHYGFAQHLTFAHSGETIR